jgi:hypothetical protein
MIELEVEYGSSSELTAERIRAQLELLIHAEVFRSSKRSVAFLKYVVEQTLNGAADQIKERSIGVEVFGRDPSYDTNLDHIVRTAATELRKRLAAYYVDEEHRSELRVGLVPGSYIPRFTLPEPARSGPHGMAETAAEAELGEVPGARYGLARDAALVPAFSAQAASGQIGARRASRSAARRWALWAAAMCLAVAAAGCAGYWWTHRLSPEDLFWKPVLDTPGPVLVAVGDHPNGPPKLPEWSSLGSSPTPVPGSDASQTVPFADTVTLARVAGVLEARHKQVLIREGNSSSFSDLREGAVVLIGAFNNAWSLRLTRQLRFSLALDPDRHLIYIKDAKNPGSRAWSWATNQPSEPATGVNSPRMRDYALISRIWDAGTGHVVVVIGGLYTYGTQTAGEFLIDPDLMSEVARRAALDSSNKNLQIVLGTTVTDGIPGPPQVLAVSAE